MANTNFVWDIVNDRYLAEVDDSGNATAVYTNAPVPYGKSISQNRSGTTSYYHCDAQGSTRQMTSQNEAITDEYSYSAFGETIANTGSTTNSFKYVGQYGYFSEIETNELYVRERTLKPTLGRWTSKDPLESQLDLYQSYGYVLNRPIGLIDPSGEAWWWPPSWFTPTTPTPVTPGPTFTYPSPGAGAAASVGWDAALKRYGSKALACKALDKIIFCRSATKKLQEEALLAWTFGQCASIPY